MKIGINGFGRIGRLITRKILMQKNIEISQINGISSLENFEYFLKYDSTHGIFNSENKIISSDTIDINSHNIKLTNQREIDLIKWSDDIDLIIECSGKFNKKCEANKHFIENPNIKNIIVSAPCEDSDYTIIFGINDHLLKRVQKHDIISCGSCTTNALVPIIKLIHDLYTIENGFFTTIHAVTNDQIILDGNHKDIRRSRSAYSSMIPTKTGANQLISSIFPDLENKIFGSAIRVPVNNVSALDLNLNIKNSVVSKDRLLNKINEYLESNKNIANILKLENQKLVSIDFNKSSYSSIIDIPELLLINENFIRILAWYDNEYGFVSRMYDIIHNLSKSIN